MEIRYQRCVSEQNIRVNLTRALGTMLAIFLQFPQVRVHRGKKRSNERSKDGALSCKHRANLLTQGALAGYAHVRLTPSAREEKSISYALQYVLI